jgi:hypothetical protein
LSKAIPACKIEKPGLTAVLTDGGPLLPAFGASGLSHQTAPLIGFLVELSQRFVRLFQEFNTLSLWGIQTQGGFKRVIVLEFEEISPLAVARFQNTNSFFR